MKRIFPLFILLTNFLMAQKLVPASSSENLTAANPVYQTSEKLIVTYEDKKLKKASVFSEDGKLLQTSTKTLIDVRKLKVGQYLIKVDFQDGTSTSAKYIKE